MRPTATSELVAPRLWHRSAAFCLVAIQATVMAAAWHTEFFPILCAAGALVGALWRRRMSWSRDQWAVLVVVIAVFCVLQQYVAPLEVERESLVFPASMALPSVEFILLIQVLAFFRRSPEDRLPAFLPGAGAILLVIVTDVMPGETLRRTALFALVVAFIVVAALFLISRSSGTRLGERLVRRRRGATIAALSTVALLTWIGGSLLYSLGIQLDVLLSQSWLRRPIAADLGFSGVSRLGTVARCKTFRSESVALRIRSSEDLGYLRGKAFDEYRNADWMTVSGGRMVSPTQKTLPGMTPPLPGEHMFHLQEGRATAKCIDVAWSQKDLGEFLFAPLGAIGFKTSTVTVSVNRHDVADTVNNLLETPYQVVISDEPLRDALKPELEARLLAVPSDFDPRIRELARRLFAGRATKQARITAVQQFFHDNFQYSLNIDVPAGKEPLAFFLFEKRVADCEYFASAAVMLLRLGRVPCRYVTGFLASEHNPYNGTWIARNRDAHAWVEAYVEPTGWTTVETTPESGIPHPHETSGVASQLWETVTSSLREFTFRTRRLGLLHLLTSAVSNPFVMLCLAVVGVWRGMRIAKVRRQNRAIDAGSPPNELRRVLKLLDKLAARHQFVRRASETIGQFADRIEEALDPNAAEQPLARVYRRYSEIRFDHDSTDHDVAELRATLEGVARSARGGGSPSSAVDEPKTRNLWRSKTVSD